MQPLNTIMYCPFCFTKLVEGTNKAEVESKALGMLSVDGFDCPSCSKRVTNFTMEEVFPKEQEDG